MHPDGEPVAAALSGSDGASWRLPLAPLSATSLEPYAPGDAPPRDTLEAAARLVSNHAAVARFASRGVGSVGSRSVSAPLSDPTATPDDAAVPHVDAALRLVAHALLQSSDGHAPGAVKARAGWGRVEGG